MWKQLGSLRERVREHAKSAAQVAQGVLQAAAAEDEDGVLHTEEYSYSQQQTENEADWDSWDQTGFQDDSEPPPPPPPQPSEPPQSSQLSHPPQPPQLSQLEPPPLAPIEVPPGPPPQGSAAVPKPKTGRRSRYVVSGINSSSSQAHAPIPAPLVPTSFITPVKPSAGQEKEDIPTDYNESEPPRLNGENEAFSQPVPTSDTGAAEAGPVQEPYESTTENPELVQQISATETNAFLQPEILQPELLQPEPLQPEPLQPEPLQPDPLQPDPLQPDPLQPEPLQPETLPPPPAIPAEPEPSFDDLVSNPEGAPTDSANKNEHEKSETVIQPEVIQSTTTQQPEPEPFIDWGVEDWTVEGEEQMGVQNASEEAFGGGPNEFGADLDWFSTQPSKTQEKADEFSVEFSEPFPSQETTAAGQDDTGAKEDGSENQKEQPEDSDKPEMPIETVPAVSNDLKVQEEVPAPQFQDTPLSEPENPDDAFFSNLGSAEATTNVAAQNYVSESTTDVHQESIKESHHDDGWISEATHNWDPLTLEEPIAETRAQTETAPQEEETIHDFPSPPELDADISRARAEEVEQATVPSADKSSGLRTEVEELREQVRRLNEEKDEILAAKNEEESQHEEQGRSVDILRDELKRSHETAKELSIEKEVLLKDMQSALRDKLDAEAERDAAIERGGDGIKEAHHLIEVMKNNEEAARERETMITEQIDALRSDMVRILSERNSISAEADDLRHRLGLVSSQTEAREEELKKQLQIAIHERDIANLEREKALESITLHAEEYERLYSDERSQLATLQEKDQRIEELERLVITNEKEKEDENLRLDILSKQIEEMKDRTRDVIEERNRLYDSKCSLEKELEQSHAREDQINRDLLDSQRETVSLQGERDEAKGRYKSMREQNSDLTKRFEALAAERDRLVQERTAAATSSDSVSEKEKALTEECEQKTKSIALFQRKLTSCANKIEKLTLQRGAFQRQRDEAGARLRAAGAEFATLHARLDSTTAERDGVKAEILRIRDERDEANLKIVQLSEAAARLPLLEENLKSKTKEFDESLKKHEELREDMSELRKNEGVLKQRSVSLSNESSQLRGKVDVLEKEKSSLTSQNQASEQEKSELRERINHVEEQLVQCNKKEKSIQADLATLRETSSVELGLVKAELLAEQKSRQETSGRLAQVQRDFQHHREAATDICNMIRKSLRQGSKAWESAPESLRNTLTWPGVSEDEEEDIGLAQATHWLSALVNLLSTLVDQHLAAYEEYEQTKTQLQDSKERTELLEGETTSLKSLKERCVVLEHELNSSNRDLQTASLERDSIQQQFHELNGILTTSRIRESELENELRTAQQSVKDLQTASSERDSVQQQFHELNDVLTASKIRESELENELRTTHESMNKELDRVIQASKGDMDLIRQELGRVTSSLGTIWGMIQKCLSTEQFESFTDDGSEYMGSDASSNISVQVLRGTASLVAELSRTRSHLEDSEQRRSHAEGEAARLADRAEIAERERDAVRGSNERLERKAKSARSEGHEEAKQHFEGVITQMEDELEELRHNLERMKDKASRSEKDSGELRALCNKLTSQLNSRTNELDELEERNVYLQDQVTNLTEDLEEAHRRLQEHEEESAVAQKEEVERLSAELEDVTLQLEKSEEMCSKLRTACDEAQSTAKESELLAETHRQGEENLRIAIEQLEAAQDSFIEQRTIELQQKLNKTSMELREASDRVAGVGITENKLQIQEEEIKELRGAIGRLADERVELKLELENSLSRLNQPDAGGQLVDRRVVRQLLVSYFRVGSVRRRDVLELMSRMLAFSDSDNIAVGLKRRALIDRLGSLVQPPELDNAALPPIGTVSDKWIEFLMKETEEGEEQAKGW
ncbi:Golgin candidate 4 [Gracilariopsis chorda]|uniref:Golgin candidate 4 n=1 Tax=Gracilariopsis chorda TaxID=448386 RepID=A0A2V3IMI5_9FLOR|nr:Golgin candidate 4 [Gracilariopsis chorda]|eukprot:PXF43304.1 Golgin candidate 4 [Gracilariopsis chorda]